MALRVTRCCLHCGGGNGQDHDQDRNADVADIFHANPLLLEGESVRQLRSIVTVVPVHNEQRLLPACLRSIERAKAAVPVPVTTIVVLDSCTDDSAAAVPAFARAVTVRCRNVGAARAAGFAACGEAGSEDVWLATTDADSTVPQSWFVDQLSYWADHDAVVGTVRVDWSTHSSATRRRYDLDYDYRHQPGAEHGHIHGANLGVRADLYHRIGGFRPLAVSEDVDLVCRLRAAGARIAWDEQNVVTTSDRRDARARGGFGDHLRGLEHSIPTAPHTAQEAT